MSRDTEYVLCELYFWEETPKARCYSKTSSQTDERFWIPRTLMDGQTKFAREENGASFCRVKVAAWKAEDLGI